ncbi:MAG: hypothetical protein U9O87_10255 [Verrucomicrobiota bacterium]|nr:hypothetical protein [Verrucomicrobiota bacterium]
MTLFSPKLLKQPHLHSSVDIIIVDIDNATDPDYTEILFKDNPHKLTHIPILLLKSKETDSIPSTWPKDLVLAEVSKHVLSLDILLKQLDKLTKLEIREIHKNMDFKLENFQELALNKYRKKMMKKREHGKKTKDSERVDSKEKGTEHQKEDKTDLPLENDYMEKENITKETPEEKSKVLIVNKPSDSTKPLIKKTEQIGTNADKSLINGVLACREKYIPLRKELISNPENVDLTVLTEIVEELRGHITNLVDLYTTVEFLTLKYNDYASNAMMTGISSLLLSENLEKSKRSWEDWIIPGLAGMLYNLGYEKNGTPFSNCFMGKEAIANNIDFMEELLEKTKTKGSDLDMLLQQEEYSDGTGYPNKLIGKEIMKEAQTLFFSILLIKLKSRLLNLNPEEEDCGYLSFYNHSIKTSADPLLVIITNFRSWLNSSLMNNVMRINSGFLR